MLFQRFPIRYRRPDRTPIQLFLSESRLLISCNLVFSDQARHQRPEGCDQTYAELVTDGIRHFWSGDYRLPLAEGPRQVTVEVLVTTGAHRRAAPVRVRNMLFMPPHVSSPWRRRLWGILRTGQLESMGTNWSPEHPGAMILPYMQDPDTIRRIAAHEAGHLFGLGDAYGAIYRFYDAAPGTEWHMMHGNWAVQPDEILMMLRAHLTGRMQFFPRHFNWTRFRTGFRADIRQRLAEAEQRLEQRKRIKAASRQNPTPGPAAGQPADPPVEPDLSVAPESPVSPDPPIAPERPVAPVPPTEPKNEPDPPTEPEPLERSPR